MIMISRYKNFKVYKPIRNEVGSGGFRNSYEYVAEVSGTIRSASSMVQLVAQGMKQEVSNVARLYNGNSHVGFGHVDRQDGYIHEIGPDWIIVNQSNNNQYKVVSSLQDDEHETDWINLTLLNVKGLELS